MTRYIVRRLLQAIPTLFGISLISFLVVNLSPGDPILIRTFAPDITNETRETLRRQLGLDQPIAMQYVNWLTGISFRTNDVVAEFTRKDVACNYMSSLNLTVCDSGGGILRGNMGTSLQTQQPVWSRLLERMPATIQLSVVALFLVFLLGIPLGVLSAVYHRTSFDNIVRVFAVIGQSVPDFWFGLMAIFFFGVVWEILPTGGRFPTASALTGEVAMIDRLRHLVLPATVAALGGVAGISRLMRTETLEVIHTDYIRTAKSKGVAPNRVWFTHALRNSLIPLMTVLGPSIVGIVGGAVVIERVFSWPGMGQLTFNAALQRDYPMVLGGVMFFSVLVIIGNLLSDIFYGLVDPRVRLS